jgi:hypothetical protein
LKHFLRIGGGFRDPFALRCAQSVPLRHIQARARRHPRSAVGLCPWTPCFGDSSRGDRRAFAVGPSRGTGGHKKRGRSGVGLSVPGAPLILFKVNLDSTQNNTGRVFGSVSTASRRPLCSDAHFNCPVAWICCPKCRAQNRRGYLASARGPTKRGKDKTRLGEDHCVCQRSQSARRLGVSQSYLTHLRQRREGWYFNTIL